MIRERVGIDGTIRPLEREEDVQACCMHPEDVGLIKEYVKNSSLPDRN